MLLVMGLPNSGKTTYARRYGDVLHLDDFPPSKFDHCNEAVSRHGGFVTVEGIYNTRARRAALLEACRDGGPQTCVWLDVPVDECIRRESVTRRRGPLVVLRAAAAMEPPTYDEGWDEIRLVRDGIESVMPRPD